MATTPQMPASDHVENRSTRPVRPTGAPPGLAIEESQLKTSEGDAIAIAFLAMPCIREHQACMLEDRLRGIASRCGGRLIVSMSEVDDITSAGINALVVVHTYCRSLGGQMAVSGLSRELHRLFKLTHLDRAINIASDVDDAARTFDVQARPWIVRAFSGRRKAA